MSASIVTAIRVMVLARRHCNSGKAIQPGSALLCLADASITLSSDPLLAAKRARKSLAYSVSAYHKDYKKAERLVKQIEDNS